MVFGDFSWICEEVALPLCPLVGRSDVNIGSSGIYPSCYARTIELANTVIYSGAASTVHIVALIMTVIMILHIRSKFTAVGRKEILTFFYIFLLLTAFSLVLDAGVVPPGSGSSPYFVAVQIGLASALCLSLFINGFVGFQLYEDGTPFSVWFVRLCSFGWFIVTSIVALLTFKGWGGLSPTNTVGLFVVMYVINAILLFVYVVMQIILVVNTLDDRWPLGDIALGVFFFVLGQVILYTLSLDICNGIQHYLDGLFFATLTNLLAVMMVYKYWDSITKEDLEFSVGSQLNHWDIKEQFAPVAQEEPIADDIAARYSTAYGGVQKINDYSPGSDMRHPAYRHSRYEREE